MKMSVFLIGVIFTTLIALICLSAVLAYLEPSSNSFFAIFLFYISLFISISGALSLLGLILRRISKKTRSLLSANRQVWDSFRQGIFLTIILIASLILQRNNLITWYGIVILVGSVGLIEFLIIKK